MVDITKRENRAFPDWDNNNYELLTWVQIEEAALKEDENNVFRQLLGGRDTYLKAGLTPVFLLDKDHSTITIVAQEDYK